MEGVLLCKYGGGWLPLPHSTMRHSGCSSLKVRAAAPVLSVAISLQVEGELRERCSGSEELYNFDAIDSVESINFKRRMKLSFLDKILAATEGHCRAILEE